MRKLMPTLALMLGFALACGDADTTSETPVITVDPVAQPTTPAEPAAPPEPTEEKKTETISTQVSIEAVRKGAIENAGRQAIIEKGKGMGYSRVDNIKTGEPTCNASTCTATVTGSVAKMVKTDHTGKVLEEKKL
jgi:hypothetical protein